MKSFLKKLFLFSLIVVIADYCWNNFIQVQYTIHNIWIIPAFFISLTLLLHYYIIKASKGNQNNFIRFYLGMTALKMMLCVIAVVAYCLIDRPNAMGFALMFMIHYLLFTVFEVASLMKELRKKN
jgi:hypothetical protein